MFVFNAQNMHGFSSQIQQILPLYIIEKNDSKNKSKVIKTIIMRPTLRQLDYLIALEEERSFSRAAEQCNVTQSTLSAGIKDLEATLDQQLVNRARKDITLTALGTETAAQARDILNNVDALTAHATRSKQPLSGTLRLGVIPTIAPYLLPAILPKLQKQHPNLQLQLHEGLSETLINKLHKRKIDTAIIAFPYNADGLEQRNLFTEDFHLAAPTKMELPKSMTIEHLAANELLLLEDGHCLTDHALAACKLQKPQKRETFSATSLTTLIQMVGYGYGVTLLPDMVVKHAALPKTVKTIPFKSPKPMRQIGMIWPKSTPMKHDCEALFTALCAWLPSK